MYVLVACEESQEVCKAFRALGAEAFSCDIEPCSGGCPEWHIINDVRYVLTPEKYYFRTVNHCYNGIEFITQDGKYHFIPKKWDLIIAHPPCTYLTVTGNRWFNVERYGKKAVERVALRENAVEFFKLFTTINCDHVAIENPIGYMSTHYRKPDQIIQPWQFGHPVTKSTCLWLKGLPKLEPTNIVDIDRSDVYAYVAKNGKIKHDCRSRSRCKQSERSTHRSKTFPGIAEAMATQWYEYLRKEGTQ